ncbi:MAG: ATP-binding protein [Solirubrobacteraceae bacterium]
MSSWRRPLSFVYGNCLQGSCGPWALFALEPYSYATLTPARKRERFGRLLAAIESLEADIQILRVSRSWDAAQAFRPLAPEYAGPHRAAHDAYLAAQLEALDEERAELPAIFIAVSLESPQRDVSAFVSTLAERPARELLRAASRSLRGGSARHMSVTELERLRMRSDEVHARLAANLEARPARTLEVQWLVRRAFCRALGEPEVDGLHEPQALVFERNGAAILAPLEADVVRWQESYVEHSGRLLRIESEAGVSWQAHLLAGALPESAAFPSSRLELMFAPAESLPFGVDLTLCARYLPNDLAMRLVRRRVQDADEIARAEAGGDQGVSDRGYDRTQDARDLLSYLQSASHPPLLRATLAVAVSADGPEELERRVEAVRRVFGEVHLHRPLGDQLRLFVAALPGQRSSVAGYDDVLTPEQVAAMMPLATHTVGARRGFHLGHTLGASRHPVRFNLREGSDHDRNAAILSIGALGSGKTTLDQKLAYEAFLLGARVIDCDPKGDHRMHELPEVAPHVETIALRGDRALRGMLDPLRIAPEHLRQDAAVSFLSELLPARRDGAWDAAVAAAVDAVRQRSKTPTCFEVVRALSAGDETDRQVAKALAVHAGSGLTQLGFADPDVRLPEVGTRQVTYLPIRDLPAPQPGIARPDYSPLERVGEQIVRLIAMFAMALMSSERSRLKVFSFDEGWRLLGDPVGRMLLASLQRMGRSELAVPIISTQLVGDTLLDGRESLDNLIGATFVFGLRSEREAERALELLDLDPDDRLLRDRLLDFDAGRCLMRDHRGRVEAVQVEILVPRLLATFSTTPQR